MWVWVMVACAPVSNDAIREARESQGESEGEDTGSDPDCLVAFSDEFDDEQGVNPPAGWGLYGSAAELLATEEDGVISVGSAGGISTTIATAYSEITPDDAVVLSIDVVEFSDGGDTTYTVLALARDVGLVPSIEVQIFGDNHAQLNNNLQIGVMPDPPYVLTLLMDSDGVRVRTDNGFDSGIFTFEEIDSSLSFDLFPEGHPVLRVSTPAGQDFSRLVVDDVRLEIGPECERPGDE